MPDPSTSPPPQEGQGVTHETSEEPVEPIERSRIGLALQFLLVFIIFDGIYLLFYFLVSFFITPPLSLLVLLNLLVVFLLKIGIEVFVLARQFSLWAGTTYFIDGKHLVVRQGMGQIKEDIYELNGIRSISISQTEIGNQLNYGNITLMISTGGVQHEVCISQVHAPHQYEKIFQRFMDQDTQ